MKAPSQQPAPSTILVVGAGVFGRVFHVLFLRPSFKVLYG